MRWKMKVYLLGQFWGGGGATVTSHHRGQRERTHNEEVPGLSPAQWLGETGLPQPQWHSPSPALGSPAASLRQAPSFPPQQPPLRRGQKETAPSHSHMPQPGRGGTRLRRALCQPGAALSWLKALMVITLWVRGKDQPATEHPCPHQIPRQQLCSPPKYRKRKVWSEPRAERKGQKLELEAQSHPETHPFGRWSVGTVAGTYRRALASHQETPYPHAAPGLGCCFPSYWPKGLLVRPAAGRKLHKSSEAHNWKPNHQWWKWNGGKKNCAKFLLFYPCT